MPNKNYNRGRRKEYKIKEQLEREGCEIAQRTAGSHSPIDVFGIDIKNKIIKLIQVKPDNYKGEKLNEKWKELNNDFKAEFEVR